MFNVMILVVYAAPNIFFVILFMCYRLIVMGLQQRPARKES
jgi:hypothetical protein